MIISSHQIQCQSQTRDMCIFGVSNTNYIESQVQHLCYTVESPETGQVKKKESGALTLSAWVLILRRLGGNEPPAVGMDLSSQIPSSTTPSNSE